MASDPRKLRPSELCRLLNSTPLGEVINERQLHRHRTRAGLRIGDARHVDLVRYVAWLVEVRHTPRPEPQGDPYEKLKQRARARNIALSLAGRDIGELPAVVNPERKERAAADFRFFCESYFPLTFHLPWSPDHLKVIAKIEQAVLRGGRRSPGWCRGSVAGWPGHARTPGGYESPRGGSAAWRPPTRRVYSSAALATSCACCRPGAS